MTRAGSASPSLRTTHDAAPRGAPPRRSLAARFGFTSVPRLELVRRYTRHDARFVEIMGTDVHYLDEGRATDPDAPVLVLIHGFASSLHTWDAVAADLAREHHVIRFDLPPFGVTGPLRSSSGAIETIDIHVLRRFFDTLMQALGIERATLIGNSLGGLLSWDYAVRHPGAVDKLVLIDAAGFPMKLPVYIDLFNRRLVQWSAPWLLPESIVKSAVRNVYGDARRLDPLTLRRYVDFFHGEHTREAIAKMVPKLVFDDLDTDVLATLDVPTLVLWGAKDRWIPPAHAAEFAKRIKGAKSVMYPGLGHIPMEEDPERVLTDLHAFLCVSE